MYKTSGLCIFCAVFFKVVQRAIWAAIFLHVKNILRAPFLPRAPPFYTAHARLSSKWIMYQRLDIGTTGIGSTAPVMGYEHGSEQNIIMS